MSFRHLIYTAVILTAAHIGKAGWFGISDFLEYPSESNKLMYERVPYDQTQSLPDTNGAEYDFIIIGSGSAGSVIANRLSEIKNWNILLLEAGYLENSLAEFPSLAALLQFTDYNWGYTAQPQPHACLAMEEQRCAWPRGKALGGSTVINYMIYTRGNPEDYNRWAAHGNPGWSYADVLPYFLKSENSHLKNANQAYHNKGGYLSVEDPFTSNLADAFVKAGQELGYPSVDYNSPEGQIGFSKVQATINNGRRHSVATAFLIPILNRKNLSILMGAKVTRILIDHFTKKAYGVKYTKGDNKYVARAKREVILSAGTLNSPQLLMLSGVGPKIHLSEFGVATFSDLPVGQTLYDHPVLPSLVIYTNSSNPADLPVQLLQWYQSGKGPISSIAEIEAFGYITTHVSHEYGYPDIELILRMGSLRSDNGTIMRNVVRMPEAYYRQMYSPLPNTPSFTIMPMLLHPKSKGYLTLNYSDPHGLPQIYGNYFTDSENIDVQTFIASIRVIMNLLETEAFRKVGARMSEKPFVGCEKIQFNSDQYWECVLRLLATSAYHPISTCKMGPHDDLTAVVNHELKVYGIKHLRVADSSIIPIPLSAHTNAPTIMIGEKVSDLIKKEWGAL